jgi:OmpA-OmpF porin, OOP family
MKKIVFIITIILSFSFMLKAQSLEPTEDKSLMEVFFLDFKEKPRVGQRVMFRSTTNQKIFSGKTDATGKAQILLPEGDNYEILCLAYADTVDYDIVAIDKEEGAFSYQITLKYEAPKTFDLKGLQFDSGSANIKPASVGRVNNLFNALKEIPTLEIQIAGHTDNVGNPQDNQKLSEARANAVKDYLVKKGIAANRINTKGFGDTEPIASNATDKGRAENRRIAVNIVKE